MPRWGRMAVLLAVMLITVEAQCVAACAILPCLERAAQPEEPPCHHPDPDPAEKTTRAPCLHPALMADSGPQWAPVALAVEEGPAEARPTEAAPAAAAELPAPLHGPPRSVSILRI
jgi:hypothetical protein